MRRAPVGARAPTIAGGRYPAHAAARAAGRAVPADVHQAVACDAVRPRPAAVSASRSCTLLGRRLRRRARRGAAPVRRHRRATTRAAATRGRCSTRAPTRARSTTSSRASAACATEDAQLDLDGSAQDLLAALARSRRRPPTRPRAASARRSSSTTRATPRTARSASATRGCRSTRSRRASPPRRSTCASPSSTRAARASSRARRARAARPRSHIEAEGPRDAKGLVILTSSASDEDSQESDLIGGSYFSHHLASGLLGGADKSGDGRVTLFEAYAYAYDRTVADTAESAAGAQHPTFSYDLAGNGDLVLTDVAARREGVYLPREAPGGVYYLVDRQGFVAAEIVKGDGVDRRIALPPGRYRVKRRLADRLRVGEIDVPRGQMVTLDESRLRDAPFSDDPVKGAMRVDLLALVGRRGRRLPVGLRRARRRGACSPRRRSSASTCAARLPPPRLGAGASTSRAAARTASCRRRAAAPVSLQRAVVRVVARRRVAAPLPDAVRGRPPGAAAHDRDRSTDDAFPAQYFSTLSPGLVGGVTWHLSRIDQRRRARARALPPLQRRRKPLPRILGARNGGVV